MTITDCTARPDQPVATNGGRDLAIDAYRAFAMFVVVAWHWVFTIAVWTPAGPRVDNPISFLPDLAYLTWVLQVMPLFFLVGGYVTARSIAGMDQPATWAWSRRRLARLAGPALPLVGALTVAYVVVRSMGLDAVASAIVLTATPLWFLVAYIAITALVPLVAPAARRWPVGHALGLIAFCVAWDVARFNGLVSGGWLWVSMATVWLAVHQLGSLADRLDRTTAGALVGGGLGLLALGTTVGPYPTSMVGTTTDSISNMGPATAILIALGLVQLGAMALSRPLVSRVADRYSTTVATASRYAMPVYLWHMIGFGVCVVAAVTVGFDLPSEPTLAWWLTRPVWIVGPALVAWPLIGWAARR